ncbi:uncharacterized protein LOC111378498 [Olea europaea var. sylvestris]|uniref:uncharacterized protein LOC111378498 n=1 Tax=Olea europaea var. sylvestris TaxID=158386 RepID=UPI000C1D531E|nr:uncharacterized protein LOC111378498 [Olea europaea var. sylvestris]
MEEKFKPSIDGQQRLNPYMKEVVRAEVLKLLDAGIIYPISDSAWINAVQVVPKKGGITVVENEKKELIPTRTMLERLAAHSHYYFLDGYSGYNQILVAPDDQEKTTFTCPYGTFAYRRISFGLCNAPEGIVLGYRISAKGIEVDRAKIQVIEKLQPPTSVKGVCSFLRDKKGNENVVADHLSRVETTELTEIVEINEVFPDEQNFGVGEAPWYADIVNYLARSIIPSDYLSHEKKKFFAELKYYFFGGPQSIQARADQIVCRCVPEVEVPLILEHSHSSTYAGQFGASKTAAKILQSGFY